MRERLIEQILIKTYGYYNKMHHSVQYGVLAQIPTEILRDINTYKDVPSVYLKGCE